jgi:hypothetical protein
MKLNPEERLQWIREILVKAQERSMEMDSDNLSILEGLVEYEVKTIRDLCDKPLDYEFTRVNVLV